MVALARVLPLSLLAAMFAIAACSKEPVTGAPGAGQAQGRSSASGGPPTIVTAETVQVQRWNDEFKALGTATARESITISAKVTETVARVNFSDGDKVYAGDVLVELTGKAEVAALKEAQAAFVESDQQYQRLSRIVQQGTVTRAALDQQSAQRDQARARSEAIRARLSDRVITAPFSGMTGFRMVSPGALVTPGTAITTLDDVAQLKIDFLLPENLLANIKLDDSIEARSDAYPNQAFIGTVRSIDSRVDPASRAVKVRALIDNPDATLKPGMLLRISVQTAPRDAIVINELALQQLGSNSFVYRVKADNSAERVDVTLGTRKSGLVEVIGLTPGERIVVEGSSKVRPGAMLTIQATTTDSTLATPGPAANAALAQQKS